MYGELTLTLKKPIDRPMLLAELARMIGANAIAVQLAVRGTSLVSVRASARWWEALRDRFIGKFVPALVTVFLASLLMAGMPALMSAKIGLVAAVVGALLDALVAVLGAENWRWKEFQ